MDSCSRLTFVVALDDRPAVPACTTTAWRLLTVSMMRNRRKVRLGLRVLHRHRVGSYEFRRVSELVYVRGRPKAILGWIDVGGVRTPIYLSDLDPAKLHKAAAAPRTFYYDGVTVDPRYEDVTPVRAQAPRLPDA